MKSIYRKGLVGGVLFSVLIALLYGLLALEKHNAIHRLPRDLRPFALAEAPPSCGYWKGHMPTTRNELPYKRYIRARNLWRSKIEWQFSRDELLSIFRDVETSAKEGDWGARALLAKFYREGLGPMDTNHILDPAPEKSIEIVRQAVAAGQPWAYYDLGVAYEQGYGGVPFDKEVAWAYYRKAAELGSPDAQMALADAYSKVRRETDEKSMLLCAFQQGHGPAAYQLGIYAELKKQFAESMVYYQEGTSFGHRPCAVALRILFAEHDWRSREKEERDQLSSLGIVPDEVRSSRYNEISDALDINPDMKLSRLSNVLPLPPAELPPWRGVAAALEEESAGAPTY